MEELRQTLQKVHERDGFDKIAGPDERKSVSAKLSIAIHRYLYYIITNNGQYREQLFPGLESAELPTGGQFPLSVEDAFNMEKSRQFYHARKNQQAGNYSHKGRNCGRKFQRGEPIYRCQECSFDDTCVLCVHCFNPDEHEGHHVYTSICSEANTGICDCGDVEAFNKRLVCLCDAQEAQGSAESDFDSEQFQDHCTRALETLFDHYIDVFAQQIATLPEIHRGTQLEIRRLTHAGLATEREAILDALAYKNEFIVEKKSDQQYVIVIWNDEYHNYNQATNALREGRPDDKRIDDLTAMIDQEGRAVLKCGRVLDELVPDYFSVQCNGLTATINTWEEFIQQETCKYIIKWMNHAMSLENSQFQTLFRESIGKVLTSQFVTKNPFMNKTNVINKYFLENRSYTELGALDSKCEVPYSGVRRFVNVDHISNGMNETIAEEVGGIAQSRVQYLYYFDHRYWKRLRKDIQDLIIPTLASSVVYKSLFSTQVVEIYDIIYNNLAYVDREPLVTQMKETSVQLFTCPTNAQSIFEMNMFGKVIWPVIDLFVRFSKMRNGILLWEKVEEQNPTNSFSICFKQGLYALETIIGKVKDPNVILQPENLLLILTLCKLFNGAWTIKRKTGEHVLREDRTFIAYLEYTSSIYNYIQVISELFYNEKANIDQDLLRGAIELLSTYLGNRVLPYDMVQDRFECVKFKVSEQDVAFMNPLHSLLSFLLEISLPESSTLLDNTDCLVISDIPLRAIVVCAQIDTGFWVRNGMSVWHQSSYYKNSSGFECYQRDIHLNQLALLKESDTERLIYNMLSRWELLDWFTGDVAFNATVYEDRIGSIMQHFIGYIYHLLTERQFFMGFNNLDEKIEYELKEAILYALFQEPLTYSAVQSTLPEYLSSYVNEFDEILESVANYREPKGLEDSGLFELKKECYKLVDPLRLPNMDNEFGHSASIIKEHTGKIIQPSIDPICDIGKFTRVPIFAKLIYKLLQVAIDEDSDAFVYELLHLIHGVFKDDQQTNGKDSIPQEFVNKPICNLLMTLIDTKTGVFSENIIKKADYLLESMIFRCGVSIFESLTDCFGEEFVQNFKQRKLNQGINFDETEKEKKKRLAKERQARIMAKFTKQQERFIAENEDAYAEREKSPGTAEDFTCALCQDSDSEDNFVIPAYHEHTPIFKLGNICNSSDHCSGFYNNEDSTYDDKSEVEEIMKNGSHASRKVFVSCNHLLHFRCFKRYTQKKRFTDHLFICPLCQTVSNCILPVYKHEPTSSLEEVLREPTRLFQGDPSTSEFLIDIKKSSKFNCYSLANHFANTISMMEVSSRLEPDVPLLNGREQKIKTLTHVLDTIAWMSTVLGRTDSAPEQEPLPNQVFQDIVFGYLFDGEPLSKAVTSVLVEYIAQFLFEMESNLSVIDADGTTNEVLSQFGEKSGTVYTQLVRYVTPTVKRTALLVKVLSQLTTDDDFFCTDDLDTILETVAGVKLDQLISDSVAHTVSKSYPHESPSVVKLVDLPLRLNTLITKNTKFNLREESPSENDHRFPRENRFDFKICLTCGVKVYSREGAKEMMNHLTRNCFSSFGLFLIPHMSQVCLALMTPRSVVDIAAPYLNSHGETGRDAIRKGDVTTLNLKRYEHLNKLWLNNEIPGYISRLLGDDFRVSIISRDLLFTFNRNVQVRREGDIDADNDDDEDDEELNGQLLDMFQIDPENFQTLLMRGLRREESESDIE